MNKQLLTIYARSPIHVGSGSSVDIVDLPIMRERITAFPVIPSTSLKGVLLQWSREKWGDARKEAIPEKSEIIFGYSKKINKGNEEEQISAAGCVQIMEGKILAFPVRSLAGCFAWITCPTVLERFNRDTGKNIPIPNVEKDKAIAGSEIITNNQVVLEEYAIGVQNVINIKAGDVANKMLDIVDDPVWKSKLTGRLAIVHDENFQHFVTTCTEVNTRIAIDPASRTNTSGALFNQENVPSESVFYSVLHILPPRGEKKNENPEALLDELFNPQPLILQIGGDETTGFGLCEIKKIKLS
jgi:CRISPR-associated protein Cmr4